MFWGDILLILRAFWDKKKRGDPSDCKLEVRQYKDKDYIYNIRIFWQNIHPYVVLVVYFYNSVVSYREGRGGL